MPRGGKSAKANLLQTDLLDVTENLRTGPCVPALREAVKAWRAGGYKGITDTTRILLNHWFYTDHKLPTSAPFNYHRSQQEAIETLVFVWEVEKVRSRKGLLERYAHSLRDVLLPPLDDFARYCIKMATGSGKTKVMSRADRHTVDVPKSSAESVRESATDQLRTFSGLKCTDLKPVRADGKSVYSCCDHGAEPSRTLRSLRAKRAGQPRISRP